jgi:hypothetical protein
MNAKKCPHCGLVNFATVDACRRCHASLAFDQPIASGDVSVPRGRSVARRALLILVSTLVIVIVFYTSLFATSDGLTADQERDVRSAIAVLSKTGFSSEALVLSRFAGYRSSDSWWNAYVGHQRAWAATNFPFAIVTLYPAFFDFAVDDTERAAILLHEAQHIFGAGEETALDDVWKRKRQLGWTVDRYGTTRVFRNTREWTEQSIPNLFRCGPDGRSDCAD